MCRYATSGIFVGLTQCGPVIRFWSPQARDVRPAKWSAGDSMRSSARRYHAEDNLRLRLTRGCSIQHIGQNLDPRFKSGRRLQFSLARTRCRHRHSVERCPKSTSMWTYGDLIARRKSALRFSVSLRAAAPAAMVMALMMAASAPAREYIRALSCQ